MAKVADASDKTGKSGARIFARRLRPRRLVLRWTIRALLGVTVLTFAALIFFAIFNPPTTFYMSQESRRLGGVAHRWVDADEIAPVVLRSVVAAEDANFCLHAGFDMSAIRQAIREGGNRGASTLSQQVVKNVFLWQGRSFLRKSLEAMITPASELIWSKRRILELYLNVAEFGEGVFGIAAAAEKSFRTTPDKLTAQQAALLAAVLPNPKERNAAKPTRFLTRRANAIRDGAETIRVDGRAACFEAR